MDKLNGFQTPVKFFTANVCCTEIPFYLCACKSRCTCKQRTLGGKYTVIDKSPSSRKAENPGWEFDF